jgi:hypothetical protein
VAVSSPPFLLGAAGQVMSGRLGRLALGAAFRPAATGVQTVSGVLAGPANTMGELALPSNTQLTVQPFRAVIQSALDATAGSYLVPNDAAVTLAVTAQNATQYRRSMVAVRVDDSQVSGVASSATTDRAVLEIIDGALAASAVAATLPTPAGSWLALGEVLIPPTGQTVTITPYNPRTGLRHGIQPATVVDGATTPGHDGAPGLTVGQYRDHPTRGLERWNGTAWAEGDTGWTSTGTNSPTTIGADGMSKRKIGRVVYLNLHNVYTGAYNRDFLLFTLPTGYTPAGNTWLTGYYFNGAAIGLKVAPTGNVTVDIAGAAGATGGGFVLTGAFPAA